MAPRLPKTVLILRDALYLGVGGCVARNIIYKEVCNVGLCFAYCVIKTNFM